MEELIAKRYIKAMKNSFNADTMNDVALVFEAFAHSFKDEKFIKIIKNPDVKDSYKLEILLSAVKSLNSKSIENLLKLLVEHNRIEIIPTMAEVMRKDMALTSKKHVGTIYSNSEVDAKTVESLSNGLSKKFNSTISLEFKKDSFDGIKVDVSDLGIEINFSKSRINTQIIEHIVKAI